MGKEEVAKKKQTTPEELRKQFDKDTEVIAEQTARFIQTMHPAYEIVSFEKQIKKLTYPNSDGILDAFTFFRLASCTIDEEEDLYAYLNGKMSKFISAIRAFNRPIVYGIISCNGYTNLVLGLYSESDDANTAKNIMEGLLDGIELIPYTPEFSKQSVVQNNVGFISAVPSVRINDKRQQFDLSSLMRSLNGQNYTALVISRPISQKIVSDKYGEMIRIRDACFAVSKRNISRQQGSTHSEGETKGNTTSDTHTEGITKTRGGNLGLSFILSAGRNHSKAKNSSDAHTLSQTYNKSISDAISSNEGISSDIQNGFALEMMDYADKAIDRLRQGKNNGMWETLISFSAETATSAGIIQACISGEMARPDPDILPLVSQRYKLSETEGKTILLPKILRGEPNTSPLCTPLTSEELGMLCSIPAESVPDFELKKGKVYPIVSDRSDGVKLGVLTEGNRELKNMPFSLSYGDLAKHTFVCGITGSGKTTTVKRILREAKTPFLVIESAKKEYRNIKLDDDSHPNVYTLGKPEINCLRMNPFYIQCGVSPQMHIDLLKDLFNASFSFYGPMPYIIEKCLQTVYEKKGWNLTLGVHPFLVNRNNSADLFEADHMQNMYALKSHKYLFPTMQDLKEEVNKYIEKMYTEGEVKGNIKSAILARLESLCSGSKGYMFNTNEYANMEEILNHDSVFELEGLADDDDKAFCVGLLIIFINEYRQVTKETVSTDRKLSHLLVIEEAHRLLKNVDTERSSEDVGNPKGKAVEHFTNMIAEMRSYGQGVIVAEQIPTKLAPDVIKNSSNKIIQRLVAFDDQNLVANTIGLSEKDAVNIGNLVTGQALCHKEGMALPVCVSIEPIDENKVSDGELYNRDIDGRLQKINTNTVRECISDDIDSFGFRILNSILIQDFDYVKKSIERFREKCRSSVIKRNVELILCADAKKIYADVLSESISKYLMNGVYSTKSLISDSLTDKLFKLLYSPTSDNLSFVRAELQRAYNNETPEYKGKYVISQMIRNQMDKNTDIRGTVSNYFVEPDARSVKEIVSMIEKR